MLFWEGTIKREHTQTLGLSSGFSDTEQLGPLTSHRPSTLVISVSLVEQSITRMNCVFYLSICMYPDLLGNFFVSIEQFDISWVGHYLHPLEPSIEQSMDHNPLAVDCKDGINQ